MEDRAVLPPQPIGLSCLLLEGDGKVKEKALRRNKRVALRDRTNVEAAHIFANAQKNNVKSAIVPNLQDKVAVNRKCPSAKKKPIHEDVIVISSDEEEEKPVSRSQPSQGSRKEVKTLTSILTAGSKAMASRDTNMPKEHIIDCDSADVNDELAVVEYVDDMYKFSKLEEDATRVIDYMCLQPEVNSSMRSIKTGRYLFTGDLS